MPTPPQEETASVLLQLPDPCLLAVLQCCDQRSLFIAARSYSRLHQAAAVSLNSITLTKAKQQQVDGALMYLGKHRDHISSVNLEGASMLSVNLHQLDPNR
jgi:hypothetical protein